MFRGIHIRRILLILLIEAVRPAALGILRLRTILRSFVLVIIVVIIEVLKPGLKPASHRLSGLLPVLLLFAPLLSLFIEAALLADPREQALLCAQVIIVILRRICPVFPGLLCAGNKAVYDAHVEDRKTVCIRFSLRLTLQIRAVLRGGCLLPDRLLGVRGLPRDIPFCLKKGVAVLVCLLILIRSRRICGGLVFLRSLRLLSRLCRLCHRRCLPCLRRFTLFRCMCRLLRLSACLLILRDAGVLILRLIGCLLTLREARITIVRLSVCLSGLQEAGVTLVRSCRCLFSLREIVSSLLRCFFLRPLTRRVPCRICRICLEGRRCSIRCLQILHSAGNSLISCGCRVLGVQCACLPVLAQEISLHDLLCVVAVADKCRVRKLIAVRRDPDDKELHRHRRQRIGRDLLLLKDREIFDRIIRNELCISHDLQAPHVLRRHIRIKNRRRNLSVAENAAELVAALRDDIQPVLKENILERRAAHIALIRRREAERIVLDNKVIDCPLQLYLRHDIDRGAHHLSDLVARPRRVALRGNEIPRDACDSGRRLRVRHILRVADIREADSDKCNSLLREHVPVPCEKCSRPACGDRSVKIKDKAVPVIICKVLRYIRDLRGVAVADQAAQRLRDSLRRAHFSIVQQKRSAHIITPLIVVNIIHVPDSAIPGTPYSFLATAHSRSPLTSTVTLQKPASVSFF